MAQAPSFDVYLSYNARDREVATELERHLREAGLTVWRDETQIEVGVDWQAALATALSGARVVAVCIGPTGLGEGQLSEIEAAEARAASNPDFRYFAVLLPGLPSDFGESSLPFQLSSRQWLDLRAGFSHAEDWLSTFVSRTSEGPRDAYPPSTASVSNAAARLSGEVTAAALVAALLKLHPEYGARRGTSVTLDVEKGERATAVEWLEQVRVLLNADAVPELHGRLVILGLARIDAELRGQLEAGGFLGAVEREIREPLTMLFRDAPATSEETVPTYTDNPAIVDELNREGFARILARRIRDMRAREIAAARATGEKAFPKGHSFLIHVHGPWGIGKTSLLNFLRNALRKPDPKPWIVVTFNAWQHQRLAPPWWWLMTSLYHEGFRELWRVSPTRALWFRAREWFWRFKGGWLGLLMLVFAAGLVAVIWRAGFFQALGGGKSFSLETGKGLVVGLAAILAPLLVIWGVARSVSRWLLTTSARGALVYIQHARDPMRTTKEHFAQLVNWLGHPLAIVIDDLDRCKPPYVVELLEGIQTLFREVPVAYVIAADREWLVSSYSQVYSSFEGAFDEAGRPLGYLFLEKTFQMTLPIPMMNEETRDGYWRQLIRPAALDDRASLERAREVAGQSFGELQTEDAVRAELSRDPGTTPIEQRARLEAAAIQLATPKLERAAEHVLQPFRPLLDANPRAMKRLVNAYGLARGIELLSYHTLGGDKQAQHRAALWTILSLRWPPLAEYLGAHPDAAVHFQSGTPPEDVPPNLRPLFSDPRVSAVILGKADGISAELDADAIRLCVTA